MIDSPSGKSTSTISNEHLEATHNLPRHPNAPSKEQLGFFTKVGSALKFLKESWNEMDPILKFVGLLGIVAMVAGAKFTLPLLMTIAGCFLFLSLFSYGIAASDIADRAKS